MNEQHGKTTWKFGSPAEHGLDTVKIGAAANAVGQINGRQGIVFVRDGVIVYEKYWGNEYHLPIPTQRNPSFSSGKSWGSSMVGVAVTRGLIKVDDLASRYHPAKESGLHPMTTIKHLLTMSSGGTLVRKPSTQLPRKLGDTRPRGAGINYRRAEKPQQGAPEGYGGSIIPGTMFFYDGVPADHLADVIAGASGMSSHAYITQYLLNPLGVEEFAYQPEGIDDNGNIRIGGSIELSVRDMARLGQLWLNKGAWDGKQLIDAQYIKDATTPSVNNPAYGYLWWLNRTHRVTKAPETMFFAGGAFGQYAFVLPEQNMVIATMGFSRESSPSQDPNLLWDALATTLPNN
jgi:CubicO group peptidase (beta-lactamase class C family)